MVKIKLSSVGMDLGHQNAFSQAIKTILAHPRTEHTMAQLVDGLPQTDVAFQTRGHHMGVRDHPLRSHEKLCDGVLERTQSLRDSFDLNSLDFEPRRLRDFVDAPMGTDQFKMRLVEMVAVSLHQIAVYLFNSSPKSHTAEYIKQVTEWQGPTGCVEKFGMKSWEEPVFAPPQTHFLHASYTDFDLYPDGVADMAGYWAEDRILGGVVLFDRGDSGHECRDIFFDSGRDGETVRIWKLLDMQLDSLVDHLLKATDVNAFSLPLRATDENTCRFDHWDAIALHRIFRDPWERRIPLEKPPEKDVRSTGDYPELGAWLDAVSTAADTGQTTTVLVPQLDPGPPTVDQSWIYEQGGHAGIPLGYRRTWKGPPRAPTPSDHEDDGTESSDSWRDRRDLNPPIGGDSRTFLSRDFDTLQEIEEMREQSPAQMVINVEDLSPPDAPKLDGSGRDSNNMTKKLNESESSMPTTEISGQSRKRKAEGELDPVHNLDWERQPQ